MEIIYGLTSLQLTKRLTTISEEKMLQNCRHAANETEFNRLFSSFESVTLRNKYENYSNF